jgi:hypothetical protein
MPPRILSAVLVCLALGSTAGVAEVEELPYGAFEFTQALTLPGSPEEIYDAITGDLSGWWDHSFSEQPAKFYLEPRPGGGFWEIFDESGDGVRHATVIVADRGKLLRLDGPLGLSGHALQLVTTYEFATAGADSTVLSLTVRGSGELRPGWAEVIEKTWHHFLVERFQPYVLSGAHRAE